jgi:hypothetical protein
VLASTLQDLSDAAVDGSYMDDGSFTNGLPLENPAVVGNINMSITMLAAYQTPAVNT